LAEFPRARQCHQKTQGLDHSAALVAEGRAVTSENRRRNAAAELERADTCLSEARQLQQASLPYGAASRAYYAVFHAARALLFSIGIEAGSHKGVVAMIGDHFVRPGPDGTTGVADAA
jgi:hypothetical protein